MPPLGEGGLAVVVLWALLGASATEAAFVEIGPEADLCAEINGLAPGDELVLLRVRPRRGQGISRLAVAAIQLEESHGE